MDELLKQLLVSYFKRKSKKNFFIPGKSYIPVSGKVFDEQEYLYGTEAVLDGWWTEGRFAEEFEKQLSSFLGVRYVSLVNSGSSANLVAFSALTSRALGKRAIKPGDEVIVAATSFPTTVNPIIQNRCIPVFVDSDISTKNPSISTIKKAMSKKTRAIVLAHTLGNPLPLDGILELTNKHNLWFIEDCCDALGSKYNNKRVGGFGHIATFSFYPAHQITMGEGGAAVTNNPLLHMAIRQFRDWGRDCWCDTGRDNTCRRRFGFKLGELPFGYDHKYTYSQIGYNLKLTDFQAAIGLAQIKKISKFILARKKNYMVLNDFFKQYNKYFIVSQTETNSQPCWFGFMITIRDGAPFTKLQLVQYLEQHNIATRSLFAGNLLKHPAYLERKDMRISGHLVNANKIMNDGFWIGVFPGITPTMLLYVTQTLRSFLTQFV